jgi:hypothetical protein
MQQDKLRGAFTTAEGWGRFSQTVQGGRQENAVQLRYGELHVRQLALDSVPRTQVSKAVVALDGRDIDTRFQVDGRRTVIHFPHGLDIAAGQTLQVQQLY